MIACPVKYRTTYEDIHNHYNSIGHAFDNGDYVYAALFGDKEPELQGCAYIMLGHPEKGLEILSDRKINSSKSLLYKAFALWCLNRKVEGMEIMSDISKGQPEDSIYIKFFNLLKKDKINILVIDKSLRFKNKKQDGQMNVLTIGYSHMDDIQIDFDFGDTALSIILEEYNIIPDFLFVFRPEYNVLFKGLEHLPFPKIAFFTDYDMHIYQKYNDMLKFDKFIVNSSTEHFEMSNIFNREVYTHIVSYTSESPVSDFSNMEKPYDILLTGSSFKTFFHDKSKIILSLTGLDKKYKLLINDGFVPSHKYYISFLSLAKAVPTFFRFYGLFPIRGMDALNSGASVLYQERGVLELFFEKYVERIFPYNNSNILESAEHAIKNYNKCDTAAIKQKLAKIFGRETSGERFLKFCAFVSLFPLNNPRDIGCANRNDIKVVGYESLHGSVVNQNFLSPQKMAANFKKVIDYNMKHNRDKHTYNTIAITYIYLYQHMEELLSYREDKDKERLIGNAIEILEEGIKKYSNELILKFNLGRIYYHFNDIDKAKKIFLDILNGKDILHLDYLQDDVMSALYFYDDYFPYRAYVDNIVLSSMNKDHISPKDIIYSSVAYYLSTIYGKEGNLRAAFKYSYNSLTFYHNNFITKNYLVTLLYQSNTFNKNENDLKKLIMYFEEAVSEYSRFIHPNIIYYIESAYELKEYEKLKVALKTWYYFFKRVRENFEVLSIEEDFIDKILFYSEYLPDEAREKFSNVKSWLRGAYLKDFSEFEEEIIYKMLNRNKNYELLYSNIKKFGYKPKIAKLYLGAGKFFISQHDIKKSFLFFFKYLKEAKYFSVKNFDLTKIYDFTTFVKKNAVHWPALFNLLSKIYYARTTFKAYRKRIFYLARVSFMAWIYYYLGTVCKKLGIREYSVKFFRRCLKNNPKNYRALYNIIYNS